MIQLFSLSLLWLILASIHLTGSSSIQFLSKYDFSVEESDQLDCFIVNQYSALEEIHVSVKEGYDVDAVLPDFFIALDGYNNEKTTNFCVWAGSELQLGEKKQDCLYLPWRQSWEIKDDLLNQEFFMSSSISAFYGDVWKLCVGRFASDTGTKNVHSSLSGTVTLVHQMESLVTSHTTSSSSYALLSAEEIASSRDHMIRGLESLGGLQEEFSVKSSKDRGGFRESETATVLGNSEWMKTARKSMVALAGPLPGNDDSDGTVFKAA